MPQQTQKSNHMEYFLHCIKVKQVVYDTDTYSLKFKASRVRERNKQSTEVPSF
jgi:hypothetical protein